MPIEIRFKALTALGLAAGAALAGHHLALREPADPCDATPDLHACAVFARPDWLTRRAYAGRLPGEVFTGIRPVEATGSLGPGPLGDEPALTVSADAATVADHPEASEGGGV